MPTNPASVSLDRLRRSALVGQGLHRAQAFGRGKNAALRALTQLGYIQIDTISVVARAHHHVLRSRVDNYQAPMLDALVANGSVFEYWFHAAAYLPMADFRYALPRMRQVKAGKLHFTGRRDRKTEKAVLERIRSEGALSARDFEGDGGRGGWWDWKPAKRALEVLFLQGDLMVSERQGFQKRYDLTERVLPSHIDTRTPSTEEYAEHLLQQCLRTFAAVTVPQASYLRRSADLRAALQRLIAERVARQQLIAAQAPDGSRWFVDPQALESRATALGQRAHILSPFDPMVIQRKRTQSMFGFDYLIECYVPGPKRVYGYFCLPILYRDTFVGRMDCKAHRDAAVLEIKALHLEENAGSTLDGWFPAFASALEEYALFNQCERIHLPDGLPRKLRSGLRSLIGRRL
ncbi:MAG: winged helix-turn-helix domain-containing protein [Pseudomonadales bacterium]